MAASRPVAPLFVQPDVIEAPIAIDAVLVMNVALEMGVPAGPRAVVIDDRASHILRQLALDLPDDGLALVDVGLLRLLVEQLVDLRRAVLRVVGFRVAGIGTLEHRIGVVDADTGRVERDGVILLRQAIVPDGGLDHLELHETGALT